MNVVNLHWRDDRNIGDMCCCPVDYFDFRGADRGVRHVCDARIQPCDVMVLGGGALLHTSVAHERIVEYARSGAATVIWGAGFSDRGRREAVDYGHSAAVSACDLAGTRERLPGVDWVPCVSCMSPEFDASYDVHYEVVFYQNTDAAPFHSPDTRWGGGESGRWRTSGDLDRVSSRGDLEGPLFGNHARSLRETLAFIGSGEVVVTSSYHGMYWATLLGRKVVAVPFSSKFYGFPYPPQYTELSHWRNAAKKGRTYGGALEECRAANERFCAKVADKFGLDVQGRGEGARLAPGAREELAGPA